MTCVKWLTRGLWPLLMALASCTGFFAPFRYGGGPVSFIESLQDVKVSFATVKDNKKIVLTFKKLEDLKEIKLKDALRFLNASRNHLGPYIADDHDCKQFAYELFLEAQKQKIKAHFVVLSLKNQNEGHALVALETSDAGMLFVDFTPIVTSPLVQKPSKKIALVREGQPYVTIPIEQLPADFKNNDLDFGGFHARRLVAKQELTRYNQDLDALDQKKSLLQTRIDQMNEWISKGLGFNLAKAQKAQQEIDRDVTALNSKYDELKAAEQRVRASAESDGNAKDWIVKSFKLIP